MPTGNFGNVFAAYMAKRMGFPIDKLLVATNENDILARFFATGTYVRGDVHFTVSPAMDIQVASNFERFLFYHLDCDAQRLNAFMRDFAETGRASLDEPPGDEVFAATMIDTDATLATIAAVHAEFDYVLDPHSAVGVAAALRFLDENPAFGPVVCVATAHPAKFPEAVGRAVPGVVPRHATLDALAGRDERKAVISADLAAVKNALAAGLS